MAEGDASRGVILWPLGAGDCKHEEAALPSERIGEAGARVVASNVGVGRRALAGRQQCRGGGRSLRDRAEGIVCQGEDRLSFSLVRRGTIGSCQGRGLGTASSPVGESHAVVVSWST